MNMSFLRGWWEYFGTRQRWSSHNTVNVPNASNLFTLKRLILCAMNFNSSLSGRTETKSGSASVQAWACLHAQEGAPALAPPHESQWGR